MSDGDLGLGPVAVPHAGDVLADELRRRILSGDLAEGTLLPAERVLAEQSRLSRATVRDSLRTLAQEGLLSTRPGRGGGSVVTRPGADDVVAGLDRHLHGWRPDTAMLLESRGILEPWCAALAAERRSADQLADLEAHDAAMAAGLEDLPTYLDANIAWHTAVADASGNDLLSAFMHAVSRAVLRQTDDRDFNTLDVRRTALRAHGRVTAAVRDRDPDAARRRMARHVHGYIEAVGPPSGSGVTDGGGGGTTTASGGGPDAGTPS